MIDRVFIPGDRIVDCDECGMTYRFSEMRKGVAGNQKGLAICPDCFDEVHPHEHPVPHREEGRLREIR